MIKSNKCDYKIGAMERKKKRYLTPELAIAAAIKLNALPNIIKKFIPYKCTVCHFFHVGRSHDDLKKEPATNIFNPELAIPQPVIEKEPEPIIIPPHDDFDWDTDKRLM